MSAAGAGQSWGPGNKVWARLGQPEGGFPPTRQEQQPGSLEMGSLTQVLVISLDQPGDMLMSLSVGARQAVVMDGSPSFYGEGKCLL